MEALKCQMCGGELALDEGHDLYLCEYCGTKYPRVTAREDAAMGSPAAEEAQGILPIDQLIHNGRAMLERGDAAKARALFRQATIHYPEDYRGWWYLFVCDTKSVAAIRPGDVLYKTNELEYALQIAPKDVLADLLRQYRAFAARCLRKGCELEIARVASECSRIDEKIAAHASALDKGEKRYRETLRAKGVFIFMFVVSVIFIILMLLNFAMPSLWMFLTIPLGLLGLGLIIGILLNFSTKDNQTLAKEKAGLLVLKSIKLVHLKKLNKYTQDLPAMVENLTVADILDHQKRVA